MFTKTLALTGALATLAAAVPFNKRDVVWVTKVEEDVVTVPVTTTVWVDPTGAPKHFGHNHGGHGKHTTVESTVEVYPSAAPAPSSEAAPSPYSAPAAPSAPSEAAPASQVAPASSVEQASSNAPAPSSTYVAPTTSTSVYVAPTSPSAYVAPTTSSSVYVAPSTYEAPSSTSAAPASYSSSSSDSGSSGSGLSYGMGKAGTSYSGDFTYYTPGMGACGQVSGEGDHMVAVGESLFDSYSAEANGNPNHNPLCGKSITITGADGSSYSAKILDRCPGCNAQSLDMPEAFFNLTTTPLTGQNGEPPKPADGRAFNMKWSFD